MSQRVEVYDVIVVGAGVEGLATARYLRQSLPRDKSVLLLEQYLWPHTRGSSSGATRITRFSYDDPDYGSLMPDAFQRWAKLESETGMELYKQTGLLLLLPVESDTLKNYKKANSVNKFSYQELTQDQVKARFPDISVPEGYAGLFENQGGLLSAAKSLQAFMNSFTAAGGIFHDNEPVLEVIPTGRDGPVTINTTKASYQSRSGVVLAMGPWAPGFLRDKLGLKLPIEAHKTIYCYWKVKKQNAYNAANGTPCIMAKLRNDAHGHYYLKAGWEYDGLIQLGLHTGVPSDPNTRDDPAQVATLQSNYIRLCQQFGQQFIPHVDLSSPVLVDSCMYTENVVDNGFILDRHPKYPNIVIGTGFSGHGFKLAPMVGEILGNLILNQHQTGNVKMTKFSINRFVSSKL